MITDLQRLFLQANSSEDTSRYSYDTEDLSKKYAINYKGIDNEQAYAQGQGWTDKMVNSVGKGLLLTGTTFLQGTVGLVNGVAQAINDGRAASFYDNDMNKWLDGINKEAENNWLPNYYTQAERDANWYSPTKLFSANFFWDGIIKNLGFAAGAALTGGVYASALKSIPLTARLFSSAKAAEALAATEEGLAAADKAASTFGKIRNLSDKFINSYGSLTTGGRALVSGLSTSGEAAFEAYNNLNEFRNKLIDQYKKNNFGLAPTEEELSNINNLADDVGNSSFLLNVGLLTATNYIQFPKILGSSAKAEKSMLNGLTKEIGDVTTDATGKIIAKPGVFEGMGTIGKVLGGVKKILPYTFSASEAFEEGAQYAIQIGAQDYYNKKAKGDATSFIDSLTEGISKTLTTNEGMENILIGGLSGALMMARGTYGEQKEKAKNTAAFIEQANKWKISDFTKDTLDSVNRGTVIQEEREAHLRQGDVLESKDSEADYVINYLTPRIKYGRFDMVQADINDLRKAASTEAGFAELQAEGKVLAGDTREAYAQRLINLESTASNMKSLYESLNIRYGNLITKDGKPLFDRKVMDQMLYAATKVADYDERSMKLSNELVLSSDVDVSEIIQEAISGKTEARDKAIASIDPLDINKEDKIQAIIDIAEISARRQKLLEEYNEIKKSPEKFREVVKEETIIPEEDLGKIVKLTTRDGEEELEIGKEYYAGKQIAVQEKDGTINKFTKFTVLGEDDKGVVLRLADGRKVTIPKDKFKQFKLGNIASSERTDNVKFYIESSDNIFTYNLGKGKKYEGSISYDPKTDKLYFTSNDGKFSRQVTRDQFSPKEGFAVAQIYSNKQYTEKAAQALTQPVSVQEKLETRNKIIVDLYNSSKDRLEEVNKKLESNKQKLNETNEALDNLSKTKEGLPRKKFTNAVKKTISTLSKIKTDVETEIAQLKIEKEELEATLPYFQDLVENAGELPQDGREMLNQLKSDVNILEELIDNTNSAIASGESLIESIDSALLNALSLMNDFVKRLKEENPNVPLFIADLQEQLEKFQGEEGAKQFIAERLGFTELVIDLESQISDFSKELKIPDLTNKIEKLRDQIGELSSSLDDFINEQIAKEKIISAFEEYAKQAKLQEEEEKQLLRRTELAQQFIGTLSNEVQNVEGDKKYEPNSKKDDLDVVSSTITAEQGKAHQLRSNRFGVRFHTLENKDDIRGMVVTAKTENELIPGLMASLTNNGQDADPSTVIALVMVNENGELIDEFGKPIPEGSNLIESAVYQVFPADELEATYNGKKETMFRESTPDNVKASLKEQYIAWRKNELAQEQLGEPQSIDASFGIPEYAKTLNDKGDTVIDYSVRTNVEDAGLITPAMLKENRVIEVATTNESVSNGSVTFNTPLGRVFLKVPGGLVKVFNRKFNNKKATTIYNVIHQLAKNALADEKNGIKTEKSAKLINWLKSVVYWGIAKDLQTGKRKAAGYNNIWFEQVSDGAGGMISKLYISGKGEGFDFTPSNLEANKEDIIFLIENLYHNVSATLTNDDSYNKPYVEILDIDEKGEPVIKEWKNYQTYLLSSQGRNSEDVPLTTPFRPLANKEDVNRKGVYFTLTSAVDDFVIPAPVAPAPKTAPKAAQPQQVPAAQPAAPKGFVLDGETKNIIENPTLGKIVFAANEAGTIFLFEDENGNLDADTAAAVKILATSKNISEASAKDILVASIKQKIAPQIAGNAIPIDAPNPTPISTAPVSETPTEVPTEAPVSAFKNRQRGTSPDDAVYREKVAEVIERFQGENWTKLESWLKKNFPNVPVYRTKNIIQATNGRQAWGMFQDGAIYVYENAQVGTAYHEVFHAVWRMFTDTKERASILNEFKNRKGSFEDILGEKIEYSKATERQIEEKLAEEFRDFVQEGKIPAKPSEGKPFIVKLFADLVSFIKEFFTGEKATSNTKNLFDKIGNGYYAQYNPYESSLSYAKVGIIDIEDAYPTPSAEFSIARVPSQQVHEIMQQMTYSTLADLIKTDKSLFNIPTLNKKELYPRLKEEILSLIGHQGDLIEQDIVDNKITPEDSSRAYSAIEDLYNNVVAEWESIVNKHEEYLKSYSIEFDENDKGTLGDESNSGKGDYQDARKIDNFRKANSAIKVLFATIPVTIQDATKGRIIKRSSIGGVILVPSDKAFITLKNKLHDSLNIDDMLENLRQLAINDPNYDALYRRLTKTPSTTKGIDFTKIQSAHSIQLLTSFFKAMKGQNADVKTVFVLPTGEVIVGDTSLSGAMKQSKNEMFNNIVSRIKGGSKYVVYDKVKKTYTATTTVKNYKLNSGKLETYIEFLKELGIEFNIKDLRKPRLTDNQLNVFRKATEGLQESISGYSALKTLTKQALNIDGRLSKLGAIKAILDNPEFESTYFNISGERVQTYIGTNVMSDLYDILAKSKNISALEGTKYGYLLTDAFSKGSVILESIFNLDPEDGTGRRISNTEDILKTGYVDGIVDEQTGKRKESSKLNQRERLIQEINLNLQGWFLNLVPGDASIEWMVKMFNDETPFVSEEQLSFGYDTVNKIFQKYFISEVNLSRDKRDIVKTGNRENTDLRFFKSILGEELHNQILTKQNAKLTPEALYAKYESKINAAVKGFIEAETEDFRNTLETYGIVSYTEEGLTADELSFTKNKPISEEDLNRNLKALSVNYMISNIEFHKLVYSDPYQYKDELKRTKNFNSPGQPLVTNSAIVNSAMNAAYNEGYEPGDIGYTDFTASDFKSITMGDVLSKNDLKGYEKPFEETDGGGVISMKGNRNFRIRAGEWNDAEEQQFRYDVAYYKTVKGIPLSPQEKKFDIRKIENEDGTTSYKGKNPNVKSAYTPIKPIVRGSKNDGENFNDVVLDKFALVPLSFRILHELNPESNAIKLIDKMEKEKVDYGVYATGRKVGAGKISNLYNTTTGAFNEEPFAEINNIPLSIMSVQSEVPSKDVPKVTQGSQITKLATMDFMEAGVPIDFEPGPDFNKRFAKWISLKDKTSYNNGNNLYNEIQNNQKLLEARIEEGYNSLLKKLGISKTAEGYVISNVDKMINTLKDEILKREVNDNISAAFEGFKKGDVILEATPAYQQIRNILYSIADKTVISPKISGGMKVQISSALLESGTRKVKDGVFESDVLKFYEDEDGKRVCEIMIGRWFKSDKSDEELIKELNESGVLNGIGFRIPTQKQNSIDVFKIAKFLPESFGDSVVIPSALVKKAGSDFDIDKLSLYLKNVYQDSKGNIKLIPYFGTGETAKAKIKEWLVNNELSDLLMKDADADAIENLSEVDDEKDEAELDRVYRKSLENEYIKSLEALVSHPLNFESLVKPNSAKELEDLSKEIVSAIGEKQFDYTSVGSMLNRSFMSSLRHAFVTGKYAIGIAATSQTNHSQNQRSVITIDKNRMNLLSDTDKKWIGDANINLPHNSIDGQPTLSMIKNKTGKYISDIIGQFIDGYVDISKGPWIMRLGASPNVAGTWLFLTKVGVPINTTAYFMNQPIIRDFLRNLETSGYTWLFNDRFVKDTLKDYNKKGEEEGVEGYVTMDRVYDVNQMPSEKELKDMLGKKPENLSDVQIGQQEFILMEFLKYAKMAEQLYLVQQGSNFDTATINDPYLVFKKQIQLKKAQNTIISSVDDILDKSFIGFLKEKMYDIRDAFADTVLMSDRKSVRSVIEATLTPYANLSDRDFVKLSQKAVNDLFDWAMQNDRDVNKEIQRVLLGDNGVGSAAEQIMTFVEKVKKDKNHSLYNNVIINSIKRIPGGKEGAPNNLQIVGNSKVYDQNQIIYGFVELKNKLTGEDKALYGKLIRLAVLQSGLTKSPISYTALIPYDDFKEVYNQTLSVLEKMPNLADFYTLRVFERNNWADTDIVPSRKAQWLKSKKGKWYSKPFSPSEINFVDKKLKAAVNKKTIPQVINISPFSREGSSDFITFSWENATVFNEETGKFENVTKEKKAELKKRGNTSFINKALFKKVYDSYGKPLLQYSTDKDGKVYSAYVYKAINAWGASYKAQEFYDKLIPGDSTSTLAQPSVINNDFMKIVEVEDGIIEEVLNGGIIPTQSTQVVSEKPTEITQEEWDGLSQEEKNKINEC
jgi:hypothetical protein